MLHSAGRKRLRTATGTRNHSRAFCDSCDCVERRYVPAGEWRLNPALGGRTLRDLLVDPLLGSILPEKEGQAPAGYSASGLSIFAEMGNVNCGPLALSLRMLLGARGIRMEKQTVLQFFKCINDLAPWFLPTGSLTLPSWEKLGRDIQFAEEQGTGVDPMVRPIWEMVRACLRTESMVGAAQGLKEARHAFSSRRARRAPGRPQRLAHRAIQIQRGKTLRWAQRRKLTVR